VEPHTLLRMSRALAHRGPDDEGFALIAEGDHRVYAGEHSQPAVRTTYPIFDGATVNTDAFIGLAHRRFSIIDLSPGGHQPFVDRQRSCLTVFNGEIYNYLELRHALASCGVQFYTQSDTEVVVEAYKRWGTDCFGHFNGFWSLALYDFARHHLLLSRDRFGKKPLYWTRNGDTIYFASEIKALLQIPEVARSLSVDEESAALWLTYGRRDIARRTSFAGITSFPAAAWCIVNECFPTNHHHYWRLSRDRLPERDLSVEEAAGAVRDTLADAVRLRLRADVPLGVELSGGLDSSALAALAAATSSSKATAYVVRFSDPRYNEEPFAREVANACGIDLVVLDPPSSAVWPSLRAITYLEEEPYHSPNLHTNQAVWSLMRARDGVKVSLNGAAGDELFAGYWHHYPLAQADLVLNGRLRAAMRNVRFYSEAGSNRWLGLPVLAAKSLALRRAPGLRARLRRPSYVRRLPLVHDPALSGTLTQALYDEILHVQMPYWLSASDHSYMGIPVEVRAPFLDYRVVELAYSLPIPFLIRDGWHKWILRKALEPLLPRSVVWRPRKMGFPFPWQHFFKESAPVVDHLLATTHNPYILTTDDRVRSDWRALSFLIWHELFFGRGASALAEMEDLFGSHLGAKPRGRYAPMYLRPPFLNTL
jgi:asparagine synthase (glutamine-hydrolysing)